MTLGVLAILGSGETAPGMTKVHRELLKRQGSDLRAVTIDTAYGFQENVPEMTEKLVNYFETSLHATFTPLHFPSFEGASEIERAVFKQNVGEANYAFAGPGSPSYAIHQWLPLKLSADLGAVIDEGGTLCFSSAAAATLGAFSPPIYEIYKVGAGPYWNEGLDLLAPFGLRCVVIPHFDNKEGANYDTSCCYLGLRRLELMERQLPDGVATLGVDEHTALLFDFDADTVRVLGRSNGYWRLHGTVRVLENGSTTPLDELRSTDAPVARPLNADRAPSITTPNDLAQRALLGGPDALEALAELVRLSATGREGFVDPRPLVEGILAARESARTTSQYALADQLRNALVDAGIEIHDGPEGSTWSVKSSSS
jgi:cyanophycinase-like exopeptidase